MSKELKGKERRRLNWEGLKPKERGRKDIRRGAKTQNERVLTYLPAVFTQYFLESPTYSWNTVVLLKARSCCGQELPIKLLE